VLKLLERIIKKLNLIPDLFKRLNKLRMLSKFLHQNLFFSKILIKKIYRLSLVRWSNSLLNQDKILSKKEIKVILFILSDQGNMIALKLLMGKKLILKLTNMENHLVSWL
jgi:hypothetical protein